MYQLNNIPIIGEVLMRTRTGTIARQIIDTLLRFGKQFFTFCDSVLNATHKVKRCLWKMVKFSINDHVETFDGVFDIHKHSFKTSKLLCYMERLRQEPLYPSSTVNGLLVFIRKLVHTKNSNNILKFFVTLQYLFYTLRRIVVFVS